MALLTIDDIVLPAGWVSLNGDGPLFDALVLERPSGYAQIQENRQYALWAYTVRYVRSEEETATDLKFSTLFNFFLNRRAARGFKVLDPYDSLDSDRGATGVVESINGVLRLTKHYADALGSYTRIITRPNVGSITLGGGAAGGTVETDGTVTGDVDPGTWSGSFWIPMRFIAGSMRYEVAPGGIVNWFDVGLKEVRLW